MKNFAEEFFSYSYIIMCALTFRFQAGYNALLSMHLCMYLLTYLCWSDSAIRISNLISLEPLKCLVLNRFTCVNSTIVPWCQLCSAHIYVITLMGLHGGRF